MNLKRNLGFLLLMGAVLPNAYANVGMTPETENVQTIAQNTDEVKLKELQEFRKKYKLADPKASESELKAAQMALKMLMLLRTGDYSATGADLWGDKVTLQHLRDVAKNECCHMVHLHWVNLERRTWICILTSCLHIISSLGCLNLYIVIIVMSGRFLLIL